METDGAPNEPTTSAALPWQHVLNASLLRRIAVTIAIFALYQLGRLLPAAGINPNFAFPADPANAAMSAAVSSSLSYFALQLSPLFSMLLLAEVFKLAFADVRDWTTESRRTRYLFNKVVLVSALVLTVLQAYGLSVALEAWQDGYGANNSPSIIEPGVQFRLTYMAGIVTGTALSIWLADQITKYGIGSGFWMLFLLPSLINLAAAPKSLLSHLATGEVGGTAVVALFAVLIASAAAVIAVARQWTALAPSLDTPTSFDLSSDMARIVLWPPFIAASIIGLIAAFLNFAVSLDPEAGRAQWMQQGSIGSAIWTTAFITVLTYTMANSMLGAAVRARPETRRLLTLTVIAASATYVALDILTAHFVPVGISGPIWIAILTVFAILLPRDVNGYLSADSSTADIVDSDT